MTRVRSRLAALALCATTALSCAGLGTYTPQQEAAIGQREAAKVAQEIGLVEEPELVAYVEAVGRRVAAHAPRQDVSYRFHVADMAEPNAFALPGGYVYVSRGLLTLANSEAELANVIGHEIAHVSARHHAGRQGRATSVGILTVLGTAAAAILGGAEAAEAAMQIGQVAGAGLIASYTRDQERESDDIGQRMALAAGYDPAAMTEFLRTLEAWTRQQPGGQRLPSFFDTHPGTSERISSTSALAATLAPGGGPADPGGRERLLRRVEGMLVGTSPAEGVLEDGRFLHPDLGFTLRVPDGWRVQNQKRALAAAPSAGDALWKLELQGPGDDPRAAADALARAQNLTYVESGPASGTALPAWRALTTVSSQQGQLAVDLTWIAWQGFVYRLTGVTLVSKARSYAGTFAAVARSFRPLTRAERAGIRELRLRVVAARPGESVAALASRTGTVWKPAMVAIVNGLATNASLASGVRVKVAHPEPYVGG